MKNILLKSVGIAEALREHLKSKEIKVAFIYGSYAKNKENFLSDIDLMVIGKISSRELSRLLSKPKRELLREINYVVFLEKEFKEKARRGDHFLNFI